MVENAVAGGKLHAGVALGLGDVQIAAGSAGALNPIREEVFAQTVRESGPGEKRTCEDVFDAMLRLVEAKDPSYRD